MAKHLRHIKIEGYKSILSLDLKMNDINILIGANGSGKSNFISMFSLLRSISQGRLKGHVQNNGGANSLLHFGTKKTSKVIIDLDVQPNGYHAELKHERFDDKLIFEKESCRYDGDYARPEYPLEGINGESGLSTGVATSEPVRRFTKEYLEDCRIYHFHDTSSTAGFKQTIRLEQSSSLFDDANNIAAFLYYLQQHYKPNYDEIVQSIRTVAPFFNDFYLQPRGVESEQTILLKWSHRDHDEAFSAQQLSDGTARFICMATLFLQPEFLRPKTIILDEPELGLHPAALEVLADIIKTAAKNSQVICSTQSVTFANQFNANDFIVVDQNQGVSTFKRVDKSALKVWLEDYCMGDIWTKNLIGGRPEW